MSNNSMISKYNKENILQFLSGDAKVFSIPLFQRNYSWETSQCEDLFNDIIALKQNDVSHYCGNILYYPGATNSSSFQ